MNVSAQPGAELEGQVRDMTHSGEAVIETEGGIVLARGALPGERVRIRLSRKAAGAQRGELSVVVEPSADRVEPACALAERCGGCPLMSLASPAQLRFKQQKLRDMLSGLGLQVEPEVVPSPHVLGYRGRARLSFRSDGTATRIGYFAAASHALVDVAACVVLRPALSAGLTALRADLATALQGEGEITLGLGEGGRCVAELACRAPQAPAAYAASDALVARGVFAGISLRVGDGAAATFGDPRQRDAASDGLPLWAAAGGFRQANPEVNALLTERVLALAEPASARVLELYAGHGNFTVGLAALAQSLRAVESDRAASDACREALRSRSFAHAQVVCADAAEGARGRGPLDVVVLDPPRTGAKSALPAILARQARRIVYVSCDLATLRRDLVELLRGGYGVDAATGFDMFPNTAHLETVVRLQHQKR
jgi:23S rRNA (uracil1939-C5)-methyltransferase